MASFRPTSWAPAAAAHRRTCSSSFRRSRRRGRRRRRRWARRIIGGPASWAAPSFRRTESMTDLPRYDPAATYDANYAARPEPRSVDAVAVPGDWRFLGRRLTAPLGIAAGPLLHGGWCRYYASLGF